METDQNRTRQGRGMATLTTLKDAVAAFFRLILHGLKSLLRGIKWLWKKIWKFLLGLAVIGILIGCIAASIEYYKHTYLPQKEREKAHQIAQRYAERIRTKDDSINVQWAYRILDKDNTWFESVDNDLISEELKSIRPEALAVIESVAFSGNPKWQCILGDIYLWGEDSYYVTTDYNKSTYWYNEAAKQGYVNAYNNLGIAYKEGQGVKADMRKAIEFLRKGAEAGCDMAQMNYGNLFADGVKIKVGSHTETRKTTRSYEHDDDKIREYYDHELMEYVKVYRVTIDDSMQLIPRDIEQAKYWWRKAAAQGNKTAKDRLQKIYN